MAISGPHFTAANEISVDFRRDKRYILVRSRFTMNVMIPSSLFSLQHQKEGERRWTILITGLKWRIFNNRCAL